MSDFPYTLADVLTLNGIGQDLNRTSIRIKCPFCSGKKFNKDLGVDLRNEKFHCYCCGISGRGGTQFHAYLHNMTNKEAYQDIISSLGIGTKQYEPIQRSIPEVQVTEETQEADEAILANTYGKFMNHLKLSEKHKDSLISRGFEENEIVEIGYSSTTPFVKKESGISPEIFNIPKQLLTEECVLRGVPGFYKTKEKNVWRVPELKPGIFVPYRSFYNEITGFQIRKDNEVLEEGENKYSWFSSANKNEGCKKNTAVHYATDFLWNSEKKYFYPNVSKGVVLITEGAMKADLAHVISNVPLIALPGITSAIIPLIEAICSLQKVGLKQVVLAFDMDKLFNINVAEGIVKIKAAITEKTDVDIKELSWSDTMVKLDGTKEKIDTQRTFIFLPETISKYLEENRLEEIVNRAIAINKTKFLFAMKNSKEATEQNRDNLKVLKELCAKKKVTCEPVLWSLKLKGIDDYYAHKYRNVEYV